MFWRPQPVSKPLALENLYTGAHCPTDQFEASIEGFFWPKIFWDFLTKILDPAVKPVPILPIFNLLFSIFGLLLEWPLPWLSGTMIHRSIEARLVIYPLFALACILQYQTTNAGLYYLIGMGVYFWAFANGEVRKICAVAKQKY